MKLSIIIPVYNERSTIKVVVDKVKSLKLPVQTEILVVDDGSSDGSFDEIKDEKNLILLRHRKNMGKGAAVRTGVHHSSGDIILIQDADLELYPEQIPNLLKPILDGNAEVVYGSRNAFGKDSERSLLFYLGGHFITLVTNVLYGTKLTDEPCGYKLFKSEIIKRIGIKSDRFEWEPEVTAKISKLGIKIHEVPVDSKPRSVKEGKKLRKRDGVKALFTLIKYRFRK